jgi:DnaK suppressor protein
VTEAARFEEIDDSGESEMNKEVLKQLSDQLQRELRALIEEVSDNARRAISEAREPEIEEEAQQERDSRALERLDQRQQGRLRDIDEALARIEASTYGTCANCRKPIEEDRLRFNPATILCAECSERAERQFGQPEQGAEEPETGRLPPDLEQLDDEELAEHLAELVREDGRVEMDELQIRARNGVVYLEGAIPSEPQHEILLNILTDIAGVQEIVDNLEVQRLAWERDDRSKKEPAKEVQPGTIPDQEPYGGTEDINLTNEEGVTYEPPENPPPHRKD